MRAEDANLQSLLGCLNYAAMVVRPGRTFLCRMIDCLSQAGHPDHFIRLNRQFHSDLLWLHTFLSHWNGVSTLRFPVSSMIVTSDASGNWGCGAFSGSQWFAGLARLLGRSPYYSKRASTDSFCRHAMGTPVVRTVNSV